jgi:hypothetical protein
MADQVVGTAAGRFRGPGSGGGSQAKLGWGSSMARARCRRRREGKKVAAAGVLGFCRSSAAAGKTLAHHGGCNTPGVCLASVHHMSMT